MRVNKKAILDTIEWAKTALANGMRVPPVPTSQVTEDILFKRAVVVALWAFWKPEQFQRQQGAGRWKAETPTINKVLSLLQTIDNVPVLDVQVDNDGMLHVKLIGAGVEHTEEDVDGDDDPDALWYTFIYAAFTPDMIAKITGNREKKFATWGYVHSIGGPQFGLGVLKAKTSCVTVRKDGAARPVYGAVVALTNDELDKMLKVALRETGVPHVLATLGVTTKGVRGAQQMYVPVPAPGGAPNGGAGGTRDFEAQDADAAASVRKTVDSLMALPAEADTYLQLLKPQQGAATIAGNEKKSFVVNMLFPEGETARVRVANRVVCNGSNVFVGLKKNGAAMEMYQIAIHAKDGLYFEQFFNVPCSVGDEEFFASVPWMRFKQKVVDVGGFMQYLRVLAKEQIGKTQPIGRALNKLFGDETLWDQAASSTVTKRKYESEVQARKREESDARFRERAEAEYETAKADFLSGKMIDAKYFEDLLSEFSITPHPRTLGWVRKNLTGLSTSNLRILRGANVPDGFRDLRDQLVAAMVEWQETEAAINKP